MTGKKIALHGKPFELFLSEKEIASAVGRMAEEINRDFQGKEVVILGVLDGAFMLLADLLWKKLEVSLTLELGEIEVSYEGEQTTGVVKSLIGLSDELSGKGHSSGSGGYHHDTGITLKYLLGFAGRKGTGLCFSGHFTY